MTDTILAYGSRRSLTDWQVEVNHAIKEIGLSFNTDAVLAQPTATSEVRLFELDNGTMSQARLAREVWDYERYAGHRVWEGARGTIGRTFPFWQRHRYTRSQTFPRLHVVLAGKQEHLLDNRRQALTADVHGIAIAVWANTLPRLQRGEPWYEIGVDDPDRRRDRYPEPAEGAGQAARSGDAPSREGRPILFSEPLTAVRAVDAAVLACGRGGRTPRPPRTATAAT